MNGRPTPRRFVWLWAVAPVVALAVLVGTFLATDPLAPLSGDVPPIEEVTVERTTLDANGITLWIRADGSEPVAIAQVQVDGAYWRFEQRPPGPLARLQQAQLHIFYPWVEGETHHVTLVTRTGLTFEHTIDVAVPSPALDLGRLLAFALLGIYVGVVPVTLGLLFYPWLRTLGRRGLQFLLALTLGLLAFLLIDTLQEGLELAAGAAGAFQAPTAVWLAAALSFLVLLAIGRRRGTPEGMALATFLALGIGLHNLGEGLAIGAAFAVGEAALGSFLVVGFTLHNVTEGIGIAAPLTRRRTGLLAFAGLAALAGGPAILGTWIGAFAFSPQAAAVFLGIGAGAILQVMVEVTSYLMRTTTGDAERWLTGANLAGFALGLAIMYGTAFLVTI